MHIRLFLLSLVTLQALTAAASASEAEERIPSLDVSKLLGESARRVSITSTLSAWERRGRPPSERYFLTTSSQLGAVFTDLASLQKSMYMRRASIRTEFNDGADPFRSGAKFADSILTVDCRTLTYQWGETKLRAIDGKVLVDLGGLSDIKDSRLEGPWHEASLLLCSD